MNPRPKSPRAGQPADAWFNRLSRPILFLIVSLTVAGAYLAITIPIAVFPSTDFPRVVVRVDNGVMPIDQMLVTITRPLEEAVNSAPGLQKVQSITSRGTAAADLFFNWSSYMSLTLQRGAAVVARLLMGQMRAPEQSGRIEVKNSRGGVRIGLGDKGKIGPSVAPVYPVVPANGKPAVLLNVDRQPDSNTLQVANEVHALIQELAPTLPPGVHLEPFYDQSTIVHDSIASVRDAGLLGLVLSSIILVLFLRDWGTSLVAGLVIPATLIITFIFLKFTDQSFNLMTLGGLAAAVGLVIDNPIVVLENIVLHRDAGQGRFQAIESALRELTVPLIGSTVTPIVVFLPLISMTGVTGRFFRALAATTSVALFSSLVCALSSTPILLQ